LDDVALLTESESDADDKTSTTADKRVVVNLMTIHASKGMEFDAVHLVGNEDGTFPTQRAISEGEGSVELDEERRLCYVAMTRAKTHLVLTWRREVMAFFGQGFKVIDCNRSRFLDRLVSKASSAKKKKSMLKDSAAPSGSIAERRRNLLATQGGRAKNRKMSTRGGSKDSIARSTSSRRVASSSTRAQSPSPHDSVWKDWSPKSSTASNSAHVARRERSPMSQSSRQRQNSKPTRTTPTRTSAPPGRNPSRSGQAQRIRLQGNPSKRAEAPKTDSTLFFPVGSSVVHKVHGAGKVLPPPESSDDDSMLVRVEFESGIEIDLPVGAGLRHQF
jgi:ATP-dependent exoDNAse (exonuclease V) beta subunit